MFLIIIILAGLIGFVVTYRIKDTSTKTKKFDVQWLAACVAFIAAFATAMFLMCYTMTTASPAVARTYELVSARDANTQTGSFIIGTGSTSDALVLNFYVKQADGGMTPMTVPGKKSTIYELSEGTPHVDVLDEECRDSWLCFGGTVDTKYKFYVPKGSVVSDFKMDAQ